MLVLIVLGETFLGFGKSSSWVGVNKVGVREEGRRLFRNQKTLTDPKTKSKGCTCCRWQVSLHAEGMACSLSLRFGRPRGK